MPFLFLSWSYLSVTVSHCHTVMQCLSLFNVLVWNAHLNSSLIANKTSLSHHRGRRWPPYPCSVAFITFGECFYTTAVHWWVQESSLFLGGAQSWRQRSVSLKGGLGALPPPPWGPAPGRGTMQGLEPPWSWRYLCITGVYLWGILTLVTQFFWIREWTINWNLKQYN